MRNGERWMGETAAARNRFIENKITVEIESIENSTEVGSFYRTEEKFLNHLYNQEKEQAQRVIRRTISQIVAYSGNQQLRSLKYYFITLFGIVARSIEKRGIPTERAFSFNTTCILLVEEKLTEENVANIADELIEFYIYVIAEKRAPLFTHHTVNKVVQHIDKAVESAMTVEGLAQMFDVSTSHLSRIFREHTGVTLVEYINIKKVEESQYYLRFSDKKISDIAIFFNFCNQSYYTRTFKKYTGKTPKRFQNNIASGYFKFTLPKEEKQLMGGE